MSTPIALLAASRLAPLAGCFGSCRFGKVRGALAKAEGLAVAAGDGKLGRGDDDQPLGHEDRGALDWHDPGTVSCEARLLLHMLALHVVSRSQGNISPCPYCSP